MDRCPASFLIAPAGGLALAMGLLVASPVAALTVAIDPGHGGVKTGAASRAGAKEKDVSLSVALLLRDLLAADKDVHVVMTRDSDKDVGLRERTQIANRAKADLLISIHCNSMPTPSSRRTTSGIETYFLSPDASDAEADALAARENADVGDAGGAEQGDPIMVLLQELSRSVAHADAQSLAQKVHVSMVKTLGAKNRGIRQAPFIVLLGAEMPAILVEIGFISHPLEGKKLAEPEHQALIAHALHDAVLAFQRDVIARRNAPAGARAAASSPQ